MALYKSLSTITWKLLPDTLKLLPIVGLYASYLFYTCKDFSLAKKFTILVLSHKLQSELYKIEGLIKHSLLLSMSSLYCKHPLRHIHTPNRDSTIKTSDVKL